MPSLIFDDVNAFAAALPRHGALAGLDLGTKTLGVAVSDATRFIATPLQTIARTKFSRDLVRLDELLAERGVAGWVLGLPLNMDGTEGPRAQSTRAFARSFTARYDRPMLLWDERLSTAWAENHLIEQGYSRAARSEVIDRVAASHILQGALDRLRQRP